MAEEVVLSMDGVLKEILIRFGLYFVIAFCSWFISGYFQWTFITYVASIFLTIVILIHSFLLINYFNLWLWGWLAVEKARFKQEQEGAKISQNN